MQHGRAHLWRLLPTLAALLIAVVAGAQPRYSLNTVGYADARLVAGSNLVTNPLNAGDNSIASLLTGLPSGSFYLPWNPALPDYGPANHYTSEAGWTDGSAILGRASAGFLWLPEARTVSFVGEPWPSFCLQFLPGVTVTGVIPKYACGFCANFTDCRIYPEELQMIRWDRDTQQFIPGDNTVEPWWLPTMPPLAPDEAVIFFNSGPFAIWGRSFGFGTLQGVTLMNPKRVGTNFVFEFPGYEGITYSVQETDDLSGNVWRTVATTTTTTAGAPIRVTVPMNPNARFYRLYAPRLTNPARTGTRFQFQFYAEHGRQYQIQRSPSLEEPSWVPVTTIDGAGAPVTVTDPAATAPFAFYRLQY